MPSRAGRAARRAPLLLALLLAGCPAASLLQPCPDRAAGVAAPEGQAKVEKPPPHTLPQALCAYWRKLCSCPCSSGEDEKAGEKENGEGGNASEEKGNKSPPANGDAGKKSGDNGKADKDKAEPPGSEDKGKKSPPAAAEGETKEGEKEESDKDKENGNGKKDEKEEKKDTWYSAHAQATVDSQFHGTFPAAYTGPRSLRPVQEAATSMTGTLFLDARLWDCDGYSGELVFNPEIAGGRGFSGVNGLGGFTNGDITRVGDPEPTPYIARLYLRQTWGFGGEREKVEDEANQIAGQRDIDRLTFVVGKMAASDLIDNNRYSHDPRTQFENWSLMYNGAWDYPANVRGYTYGIGIDFNQKYWALRYGVWAEPLVANGAPLDPKFLKAQGQALEWEGRWGLCEHEHPGRVRLMAYLNRAHMGDYREATEAMPVDPVASDTAAYRFKYGFGMNFEQELTRDLGLWGRLGWNDGHTETWAFTPIDRTAALGLSLKGRCWARPDDTFGLAAACNGIAKDHRDYLAAGGLDFNIGDGALRYGWEEIVEVYYSFAIVKGMYVLCDFQGISHPAYNRDRGPVAAEALMVHIEF